MKIFPGKYFRLDGICISVALLAALVSDLPTLVPCPLNYGLATIADDIVVDSTGGRETTRGRSRQSTSGRGQHLNGILKSTVNLTNDLIRGLYVCMSVCMHVCVHVYVG